MTRSYDQDSADRLIPLLRSVQRELRERADRIRSLRLRIERSERQHGDREAIACLRAELSQHKLESRLARKELHRLGCSIEDGRPERVLIPGSGGDLAQGWSWSFGDGHVELAGSADEPSGRSGRAA
jgi:hypothetical protein